MTQVQVLQILLVRAEDEDFLQIVQRQVQDAQIIEFGGAVEKSVE